MQGQRGCLHTEEKQKPSVLASSLRLPDSRTVTKTSSVNETIGIITAQAVDCIRPPKLT